MNPIIKKYMLLLSCFMASFFVLLFPLEVKAEGIVVVLDPGHGGGNHGAEWNGLYEKDITMVVANSMANTLNQFEGITVYCTRTGDQELSLDDRAIFARDHQADYLYCLHFNMSAEHNLYYGSEFWIPSKGQNYAKGYQFSKILADQFADMGLFIRGIKTKVNDEGNDYYGIIRHCEEYGIPSTLIEHCHLDQKNDVPYYDSQEDLIEFGRQDAIAVAKYFGLYSPSLGLDFRGYALPNCEVPSGVVRQDITPADVMQASVDAIDAEKGKMTISLLAEDHDSYVNYYCYSLDGGNTYSDLMIYPNGGASFTIDIPRDREINLMLCSYNSFDQKAYTENMNLGIVAPTKKEEPKEETVVTTTVESKESIESKTQEVEVKTLPSEESIEVETVETETMKLEDTILLETEEVASTAVPVTVSSVKQNPYTSNQKILLVLLLAFISLTSVIFSAIIAFQVSKKRAKKRRARAEQKKQQKQNNKHSKGAKSRKVTSSDRNRQEDDDFTFIDL